MVSLQKQEYIPDFRLGIEYVTMPLIGEKRWSVSAGITLPIAPWSLSKASARVQEASAEKSMRESMYIGSRRMIEAQVRQNFSTMKAYEARVRAYESTILPQTDQSLRALLTEYQTGRTSFLMLLDSFRMYRMAKMESAMALMQYHKALAALERSVGVTNLSAVPKENEQ
jgi:outer membrane protein TolC